MKPNFYKLNNLEVLLLTSSLKIQGRCLEFLDKHLDRLKL